MHHKISREHWEQNERARCWEGAEERVFRKPLSDWLSQAEIAEVTLAIRERWKECGRLMRTADEQQRDNLQWERRELNRCLKEMREDEVPFGPYHKPLTQRLYEMRRAAVEQEYQRAWNENNRISDEKWAEYLQWLKTTAPVTLVAER